MIQDEEIIEENHLKHTIDKIQQIEDSIKIKPTKKDLKETIALFKDFEIDFDPAEIPDFKNVAALHRWRISVINKKLGGR